MLGIEGSCCARQANSAVMDAPAQTLYELDTPENLALCDELCGAVDAAVDALPDEQRMAIGLREFQDLSYLTLLLGGCAATPRPLPRLPVIGMSH